MEYVKQFKEIKIIQNYSNLWTSWWRNKIANYAKWEYIFFIDNDVELTSKSFISDMLKAYTDLELENIWVLVPIFRMENDNLYCEAWLYYNKVKKIKFEDVYEKWYMKVPGFATTAFLISKKIFFELWCFDEKYPYNMDDNDFSMRLYIMWYTIFVNLNLYAIHHWVETRTTAKWIWWRYQYYFCGLMRAILKNYTLKNLLLYTPIIFWWSFTKSCKNSIKYCSLLPLKWFFLSVKNFFKDLPDTLKERRYWQMKRKVEDDYYLRIQ